MLEAGELSASDADALLDQVAQCVPARVGRAAEALGAGTLDVRLIVPQELTYWEGLCGLVPGVVPVSEWIAADWHPRVRHLVEKFGATGFRLAAAANAKPGMIGAGPSYTADLLATLEAEALANWGPLAVLGLAEAAARVAQDNPDSGAAGLARRVAAHLVMELAPEGADGQRVEVFAGLFRLIAATLAVNPATCNQRPWWLRLCALAQADLVLAPLLATGPEVPSLLAALDDLIPPTSGLADLLSLDEEPLWRAEMATVDWLRAEVLGRTANLLASLDAAEAGEAQALRAAIVAGGRIGNPWACASPGPLECSALPNTNIDSILHMKEALDTALAKMEEAVIPRRAFQVIDMVSRHGCFGPALLDQLAAVATRWVPTGETADERWAPLLHLARTAASQSDRRLAEAVLQTVAASPKAADEPAAALQIALAASATWPVRAERLTRFAVVAEALAWRPKAAGCAEVEAIATSVAERLPIADGWHTALAATIARLGASARGR